MHVQINYAHVIPEEEIVEEYAGLVDFDRSPVSTIMADHKFYEIGNIRFYRVTDVLGEMKGIFKENACELFKCEYAELENYECPCCQNYAVIYRGPNRVMWQCMMMESHNQDRNVEFAATLFKTAGNAQASVSRLDLEILLGLNPEKFPKTLMKYNWVKFCEWVYKKLTGEKLQPSSFLGRGFTSRYYGEQVAKAIRDKYKLPA